MTDLVLINSPDVTYSVQCEADPKVPLGLLYIASYAAKFGFTTQVIDCHAHAHTKAGILELIVAAQPKLVGINVTTPNRRVVFDLANAIKQEFPQLPLVLGGPHVTSMPEDAFAHVQLLDAVVLGEGEIVVSELLRSLPRWPQIEGLFTLADAINHAEKKLAPRITDLNALPFPDYGLIDISKYLSVSNELYLSASRGCVYDCAFCSIRSLLGRGVVSRSSENVLAEMRSLANRYGIRKFYFYDDDFMLWGGLKDFCVQQQDEQIKWTAQGTLNDVRGEESARALARAGCYRLSFGLESGSYRLQRYIAKVIKDRSLELIPIFRHLGVQTRAYFVFGFPQEERYDIIETFKYLIELRSLGLNDISAFAARPYPGTRLFEDCVQRFGHSSIQSLLDFYYLDDWRLHNDEIIRERLRRYNTVPQFQINAIFTPFQIREVVALANEVFFHAERFRNFNTQDFNELLSRRLDLEGSQAASGTAA